LITADSRWRSLGNVSRERWRQQLEAAGSPIAAEWETAYEAAYPHTALALAMMEVESRYFTRFNQNVPANRNPLNLRPPTGGGYLAFNTLTDGIRAWRDRITDPQYKGGVYDKTVSILELVERYAPGFDNNDPSAYAAIVAARVTAWLSTESGAPERNDGGNAQMITAEPCPIETYVAWSGPNRPGLAMPSPSKIVIHEVGNQSPGADEDMHRRFVLGGGGINEVSFHFVVGPDKIVQLLYLDENAWHASDGYFGDGNRDGWGIEHIQIGDFTKTLAHGAWLCSELARNPRRFAIKSPAAFVQDINPENVDEAMVQHNWEAPDGKNCPQFIRTRGLWAPYVEAVRVEVRTQSDPGPIQPSSIWWEPGTDWGVQRRSHDGALAIAFEGEVTAKRNVPLRRDAHGSAPVVHRLAAGDKARIVGTYMSTGGKRTSPWAFIEYAPGKIGRAPLSAFDPYRWPTV